MLLKITIAFPNSNDIMELSNRCVFNHNDSGKYVFLLKISLQFTPRATPRPGALSGLKRALSRQSGLKSSTPGVRGSNLVHSLRLAAFNTVLN